MLTDADSQPGTVVVIYFYAVVALLAVDGASRSIDMALHTIFLQSRQPQKAHVEVAVFLPDLMVDRGEMEQLGVPFVVVDDLRDDAGISVDANEKEDE